jgi:hypothetical protein
MIDEFLTMSFVLRCSRVESSSFFKKKKLKGISKIVNMFFNKKKIKLYES